MVLKYWTVG